jgi:hypothetical protein
MVNDILFMLLLYFLLNYNGLDYDMWATSSDIRKEEADLSYNKQFNSY